MNEQVEFVLKHGPCMSMTIGSLGIGFTPQAAVNSLKSYGVNCIKFTPTPMKSKKADYDTMSTGKRSTGGTSCKPFSLVINKIKVPSTIHVIVPDDYKVYRHNDTEYKYSSVSDIKILRSTIWHEIVETAFLYTSYFEAGDPYKLLGRMLNFTIAQTPAHDEVQKKQKEFLHAKFYGWPIVPPDPKMYYWNVCQESGKIIIKYGCWPNGFLASVYNQEGNKMADLAGLVMKPGGFVLDSKGSFEPGLYFIKLKKTSITPSVKKAILCE